MAARGRALRRRAMVGGVGAPKRRATYEDLCRVPEHMVAEIIDGELIASPRPAAPHALAASMLGAALIGSFGGPAGDAGAPGGWWILFEPELHLGEDVVVPDFAGWRRERMPTVPDVAAFRLPPDWACEVVSPSTGRIDRSRKMHIYAREGVGHLWLVDPGPCTLEVYLLERGQWIVASTYGGAESVHAEPFDAVALDMRRWWRES